MCGIAGAFNTHGTSLNYEAICRMVQAVRHRGPDDEGLELLGGGRVALGHTRLSIVDLSPAGHQPIWNDERAVGLIYNGEVYNFVEVREELERTGHTFRSRTDSEVILKGFERWGIDVLGRLNGMFAFALWDGRAQELWLVRDRLGKKPLYYHFNSQNGTFLFASEIKSILEYPDVRREVNPAGLECYLTLGYVPAPHTMFAQIWKLPAGHWLNIAERRPPRVERYWRPPETGTLRLPLGEHRRTIRALVEEAIKRRLISDVPLGAFLSGGVDSTIVVGTMSRMLREPVRTFSAAFEVGPRSFKYNVDADAAEVVSRHFGTRHTRLTITPEADLMGTLRHVVRHMDEPIANPTLVTTYLLAQEVKRHGVSVMLSGDGSDEIFGGYDRYLYDWRLDWMARIPEAAVPILLEAARWRGVEARLAKGLARARLPTGSAARYMAWWTLFGEEEKARLISKAHRAVGLPEAVVEATLAYARPFHDNREALTYGDLCLWIAEESNMRMDKMCMAHALETRAPFLDYRLVEHVMRIPFREKVGWTSYKKMLKQAFSDVLPKTVMRRPKWGWFSPVHYWVKDFIWPEVQAAIGRLPDTGFFDARVRELVATRPPGEPYKLWMLLVFALWQEEYLPS